MNHRTGENNNSFWLILAVILIGWVVYTFQVLIGPLIISALLAYLLNPVVSRIADRTGTDRRRVVPIAYLASIGLLVAAIVFLAPVFAAQANVLPREISEFPEQAAYLVADLEEAAGIRIPLESFFEEFETDLAQFLRPERVFRLLLSASTNFIWVILILISSYHLLRDWARLREWLFAFSPADLEPDLRRLHQEIKKVWQAYLRGQLLIMSILAIVSAAALALLGLPGWLYLGLLAGGLALIPTLGPAAATLAAAIVAWLQGSVFLDVSNGVLVLLVVAVFQVIQLLEGIWLTPRIMGRRLNLHPGLVLVAVVGSLFTLGALVALIIVPLIGSLDQVLRYVRRRRAGLDPWDILETDPEPEDDDSGPESAD